MAEVQFGCSHAWQAPTTGSRVPSGGWDLPHQTDSTDWSGADFNHVEKVLPLCVLTAAPFAQAPQRKRPLPLDLLVRPS
jgi:hypothetical protein